MSRIWCAGGGSCCCDSFYVMVMAETAEEARTMAEKHFNPPPYDPNWHDPVEYVEPMTWVDGLLVTDEEATKSGVGWRAPWKSRPLIPR